MIVCVPGKGKDAAEVTVTFTVTPNEMVDGHPVAVVGDFNDWDPTAHPLTRRAADGALVTTIAVAVGRRYAFRYLAGDGTWFDEEGADGYEDNGLGGKNAILDLTAPTRPDPHPAPAMAAD